MWLFLIVLFFYSGSLFCNSILRISLLKTDRDDTYKSQVALLCLDIVTTVAWYTLNVFICFQLAKMSEPLTQ